MLAVTVIAAMKSDNMRRASMRFTLFTSFALFLKRAVSFSSQGWHHYLEAHYLA
jgi:hypothetical protein